MASRQLDMQDLSQVLTLGELSLDGTLHPVRGALPMVIAAKQQGITDIILPAGNAPEVSCIQDIRVYPAESLDMVVQHLNGRAPSRPRYSAPMKISWNRRRLRWT